MSIHDGIIKRSKSHWCGPVVLAKKKDGFTIFCAFFTIED